MLDANMLIAVLSGAAGPLGGHVAACEDGDLVVSAVAFAEVALGSSRGKGPSLAVLDQLPRIMPVLPFDHLAAKHYAELPFRRGGCDRLIAAHAKALNLTLVTNNERDFLDVVDLRVENWMR